MLKSNLAKSISRLFMSVVLALTPMSHSGAQTAHKPLMQITEFEVKGNLDVFLGKVKLAIARQNQVAPGIGVRIFQGTLAGSSAGTIYIVKEYRSMAFMAEALAKLHADAEWNRLRKEAGMAVERVLVSDSLFEDITP